MPDPEKMDGGAFTLQIFSAENGASVIPSVQEWNKIQADLTDFSVSQSISGEADPTDYVHNGFVYDEKMQVGKLFCSTKRSFSWWKKAIPKATVKRALCMPLPKPGELQEVRFTIGSRHVSLSNLTIIRSIIVSNLKRISQFLMHPKIERVEHPSSIDLIVRIHRRDAKKLEEKARDGKLKWPGGVATFSPKAAQTNCVTASEVPQDDNTFEIKKEFDNATDDGETSAPQEDFKMTSSHATMLSQAASSLKTSNFVDPWKVDEEAALASPKSHDHSEAAFSRETTKEDDADSITKACQIRKVSVRVEKLEMLPQILRKGTLVPQSSYASSRSLLKNATKSPNNVKKFVGESEAVSNSTTPSRRCQQSAKFSKGLGDRTSTRKEHMRSLLHSGSKNTLMPLEKRIEDLLEEPQTPLGRMNMLYQQFLQEERLFKAEQEASSSYFGYKNPNCGGLTQNAVALPNNVGNRGKINCPASRQNGAKMRKQAEYIDARDPNKAKGYNGYAAGSNKARFQTMRNLPASRQPEAKKRRRQAEYGQELKGVSSMIDEKRREVQKTTSSARSLGNEMADSEPKPEVEILPIKREPSEKSPAKSKLDQNKNVCSVCTSIGNGRMLKSLGAFEAVMDVTKQPTRPECSRIPKTTKQSSSPSSSESISPSLQKSKDFLESLLSAAVQKSAQHQITSSLCCLLQSALSPDQFLDQVGGILDVELEACTPNDFSAGVKVLRIFCREGRLEITRDGKISIKGFVWN